MSTLKDYRNKRHFERTPEPRGSAHRSGDRVFVIQKHAATRLHYDLRLEVEGVLKSWAVPKGPSMNPAEKRLAVRTEDHPLEYAEFEGVIPEGQYGAGTVMVWDTGPYESHAGIPPEEQLARGKIDVVLHGTKLRGGFTLVRTGKRSVGLSQKERWMLIKHRDEHADPSWDIVSAGFERSVLTGRSLMDIEMEGQRKTARLGRRPPVQRRSARLKRY